MRFVSLAFAVVAAATVLLSAEQSQADIIDGSFTAGLVTPWETDITGDSPANADATISTFGGSSSVLKLTAINTYTWADGEWTEDQIAISRTAVGQSGIEVQEGTTALQFHAAAL
ncbi:MAG: hypothetical protein EHM48_00805 [Planctomycetaceae bacterium]|nr:MAG: hypothetical protein EHM48_00805 [Planctomycetaceae bacterium]